MTAQENFSQLGQRIDEAQAKVEAAARQSRDELQAEVEQAQSSAEQKADEIKAQAARGKDEAATGWQSMKTTGKPTWPTFTTKRQTRKPR